MPILIPIVGIVYHPPDPYLPLHLDYSYKNIGSNVKQLP
ncbi:hypothetical protein DSUL_40117 [Desulfovibrionales bacterium]